MKIIRIGRDHANDKVINDPLVSRNHCQIIENDQGSFIIIDNSTNGTFVNGVQIGRGSETRLNKNDIVRIGNTTLPWLTYFTNPNGGNGTQQLPLPPSPPPRPNNFLAWAILATIFCCLPFGIVSIVKASKVDRLWAEKDYTGAIAAAKSAKTWFWVSFSLGLTIEIIYIILSIIGGTLIGLGSLFAFL